MQELQINKIFNTYEELEEAQKKLNEKYKVFMFVNYPCELGQEIYGIQTIIHFGER